MIQNSKIYRILMSLVMLFFVFACLLPFALLISGSLSSESSLKAFGYTLFPREFSLEAYQYIWTTKSAIFRSYGMSLMYTAVGTIANMCMTFMFAYPLSRESLPGRKVISFILFFTMLFNGGFVPTYLIYANIFHIVDTYWGMVVPYLLMNAFYVIMCRTYITSNVPNEVVEAARIDGAGEMAVLLRVVTPMSRPILATIALMSAIAYWNNWTNGVYFIRIRTELYGIQNFLNSVMNNVTVLSSHSSSLGTARQIPSTGIRMALAVIAVIPVLIAYPFFQKYFVKGVMLGSLKE